MEPAPLIGLTIPLDQRATTYHMKYQLMQLAGNITPGLSDESCAMIERWIGGEPSLAPFDPPALDVDVSVSHLERQNSTLTEALRLTRELIDLLPGKQESGMIVRKVYFNDCTICVSVRASVMSYESSPWDKRRLTDVLTMGVIEISCDDNDSSLPFPLFTDSHLISRAKARALLELAQ